MSNTPWTNKPKIDDVKIPKDTEEFIDVICNFVSRNGGHEAINGFGTALGVIMMHGDDKDLENARTVCDQVKFTVLDGLTKQGWK